MMANALKITAWTLGSVFSAELLGYGLHRLLHSGAIAILSRSHMKHHLVLYGPQQDQRSANYRDSTEGSVGLGNIGVEWLLPSLLLIAATLAIFAFFHVRWFYQLIYLAGTLGWSFVMFSYLHDVMHVEGIWLARSQWLKRWFFSARTLHDIHHHALNNYGLMDKNFGIGFFLFDRIFGTLALQEPVFNQVGFRVAKQRFEYVLSTTRKGELV